MSMSTDKPAVEHLIDVAGEIFAAKGAAATVREICGQAGCSVAAINYYFGDKQQLYERCVRTACEQKQRLFPLPKAEAGATPESLLRSFLRAMLSRIAGHSKTAEPSLTWHNTLMMREVLAPSPEIAKMLATYFQSDYQLLEQLVGKMLGPKLNTVEIRRHLCIQILARCMFLRTGKQLREMLSISSPECESPELYADSIYDSIVLQVQAMQGG